MLVVPARAAKGRTGAVGSLPEIDMPSPFPGMDPYLENPDLFGDFHDAFIFCIREALQPTLPEPYYAQGRARLWVESSVRHIEPDLHVRRRTGKQPSADQTLLPQENGGIATATAVATKPVVVTVPHDEHREPFLEIRTADANRLVAVIELLSPTNKARRSEGRKLYREKQREVLDSEVHLVEIDLLRGGEHTTAVALDWALEKTGPFDYHVCIHRFDRLEDYLVYPILLENRLPELAIPLLPEDGDVTIDLQAVFDRCYDTGPYRRRVDYDSAQPQPPLDEARWAWSKRLLAVARP